MQLKPKEIEKNTLEAKIKKLKLLQANAVQAVRETVELKEGYLLEIENLENEISEKKKQLSGVVSSIFEKKAELIAVESKIKKMQQESLDFITKKKLQVDSLEKTIQNKTDEKNNIGEILEINTIILNNNNQNIQSKKDSSQEIIKQIGLETKEKKSELNNILVTIKSKTDELVKVENRLATAQTSFKKREEAIKQREEELLLISNSHNEREKRINTQEADIRVIKRRLKREYEKVFPGRKLTI